MAGVFITFEGGEGAGKSTQIQRLTTYFQGRDIDIVVTREPGGTPAAEELRALLVNGSPGKWSSTEEALLNYAARAVHLRDVIRPALLRGQTVLCDRFMDSTRAYQVVAGDCPLSLIEALELAVVGPSRPNLTFVFDLDPAVGLARAKQRGANGEDRYERKGLAFHAALRQGFLDIAQRESERCVVVDASQSVDLVWSAVLVALKSRGYG
jgi:dTMP kinase